MAESDILFKAAGVVHEHRGQAGAARLVDINITHHHTVLVHGSSSAETWIAHSLLLSLHLQPPSGEHHLRIPLVLRGRDFETHTLLFSRRQDAKAAYDCLSSVVTKRTSSDQLYAFKSKSRDSESKSWQIYEPLKEFIRMGALDGETSKARTSAWRITNVNQTYDYCPTYPATLVVPSKISDTTLNYGKIYRSKSRIPSLVYLHWANLGSITRSSQPMVGIKNNRSIQDEKLIEAIFTSHSQHHSTVRSDMAHASYISHSQVVYGATSSNLIIDARPTTNAMANVAKGAGTENMEYYRNCKKLYLGIDNIHVMRESLARVIEATRGGLELDTDLLRRSGWLKHLSAILEGVLAIVKAVHLANSHVLVHCSDGWDRTSQLSSLSQVCLDPFYRTKHGLAILIEKDWISFGHRFNDRCGHLLPARVQLLNSLRDTEESGEEEQGLFAAFQQRLNFSSTAHLRETCPVFDQFLDVVHQLQVQFPQNFEFNDNYLLDLQRYAYECAHGTFLYNSEQDRKRANADRRTRSVWQDLLDPVYTSRYDNPEYVAEDKEVLFPNPTKVKWWRTWFKQPHMDSCEQQDLKSAVATVVADNTDDPLLAPSTASNSHPNAATVSGRFVPVQQAEGTLPQPVALVPRQLSTVFDNNTVASAGTAVHGAMRSAWSAWRSVRSAYDGHPPPNEGQTEGSGTRVTAALSAGTTSSGSHQDMKTADTPHAKLEDANLTRSSIEFRPDTDTSGASFTGMSDTSRDRSDATPITVAKHASVQNTLTPGTQSDPLGVGTW